MYPNINPMYPTTLPVQQNVNTMPVVDSGYGNIANTINQAGILEQQGRKEEAGRIYAQYAFSPLGMLQTSGITEQCKNGLRRVLYA